MREVVTGSGGGRLRLEAAPVPLAAGLDRREQRGRCFGARVCRARRREQPLRRRAHHPHLASHDQQCQGRADGSLWSAVVVRTTLTAALSRRRADADRADRSGETTAAAGEEDAALAWGEPGAVIENCAISWWYTTDGSATDKPHNATTQHRGEGVGVLPPWQPRASPPRSPQPPRSPPTHPLPPS